MFIFEIRDQFILVRNFESDSTEVLNPNPGPLASFLLTYSTGTVL